MSFPILVDIYAEPIISQVMNVYPTSSPTLSIPRVRIKSDVIGFDGEVEKSYTTPTPHHLIRPGFLEAEVAPGISDLFELANVSKAGLIMNRRYTVVEGVKIKAGDEEFTVECMLRPDARDHVSGDAAVLEFTGPAGSADEGKISRIHLSLHFDYDSGSVTNSAIIVPADDAELTYEYSAAKVVLKFTAKGSDKGRTINHIEQEINLFFSVWWD